MTAMKQSLVNFMDGIIDYAGLFPPANLNITTALHSYAAYREGRNSWILGRFVIPAGQLHLVPPSPDLPLSVILSAAPDKEKADGLRLHKEYVEVIETRLPNPMVSVGILHDCLKNIESLLTGCRIGGVDLFMESPEPTLLVQAIATLKQQDAIPNILKRIGLKLRCGGLDKQSFPAPAEVSAAIISCRDYQIPVKFTAGLHHPFRSFSAELQAKQHGFINVFAAALLAENCALTSAEIEQCLSEEDPGNFTVADEGFSWKDKSIANAAIKRLRCEKVISFGSCSFAEPLSDLQILGFLDA